MKIKLFTTLVICFFATFSEVALAADIDISTSSGPQVFTTNNQKITISPGGDVVGNLFLEGIFGSELTGLQIIVNANANNGITSDAGATTGAVLISDATLTDLSLNSGRITSPLSPAISFVAGRVGTNNITLSSGTTISNTSGSGGTAIYYDNEVSDANLVITNSGTISVANHASSNAILFSDSSGGSVLTVNNTGGTITAGTSGKAISVLNGNSTTIDNSDGGIITGAISAVSGNITITNDESSTITGDIDLGSDEISFITNSGTITGDLTFGNSTQYMTLGSGGIFSGTVSGEGTILLESNSSLTLNSGTIDALITSSYSSQRGNLHIAEDQSVIVNYDISTLGSGKVLEELVIHEGATLDFATNNKIAAFNYGIMHDGSTVEIGNATLAGDISSNTSENLGTVNFHDNYTLGGNIGSGGFALNTINVATGKAITNTSDHDIAALTITINDGASISTTGGGRFDGAASLGDGSILTLGSGTIANGSINGPSSGNGTLNIEDGIVLIYSEIGDSAALSEVNVNAGSQGRFLEDIAANNVNFSGQLDFEKTGGNAITGNLTGSGSGVLRLYANENTVSGNLTIASGNTLLTTIATPTTAGSIVAAGTASVSSNTILKLSLSAGATRRGSTYTIVSGSDGSTINKIEKENIRINDISTNVFSGLKFSTSVSGNDLILSVSGAAPLGSNNNQRNLYNHITGLTSASGNLLTIKNLIDAGENEGTVSKALESVNSQVDNSSNRVSFNNTSESLNLASERLDLLRGVSSGDDASKKSIWGQTFGSKIHQGNNSVSQGYQASSYGFAFGFDHEVSEDVISGLSLSYVNSDINSIDKLKKTQIDTYQINLYGSKNFENYFLNAMAGFAFNNYASRRNIETVNALASAKYSGETYIAKIEAGSNYKVANDFILTPTFAVTAARNSVNSYEEGGAGTLNLAVKNNDTNFFETRIGSAISKNFKISQTKKIRPNLSLSYGYDFAGSKQRTNSRFVGQSSSFASSSANMPQGSLRIGGGLQVFYMNSFSLDVGYDFDHRVNYNAHSGSLKAKYEF